MTSGKKMLGEVVRRARALLALCLLCTVSVSWAFDLDTLMSRLAAQPKGEARFTEQRFVRGIEGPLESSGSLSFTAPDKLVRRTESPREESMVVDGNALTLSRGGRTRSLALDSMPELRGMVDALRGTLSGDARVLRQQFKTELGGTEAAWTLQLTPVDERLAAQVRTLRLTGRGGDVLGVEMEFIGGDRSVMRIVPQRGAPKKPS
ncbi:outer membrane lipoprotein carrier protein LolA [Variovorax dokdonensis]|uniref:Outer membrane lipoprotein carrier protein LolA n=1 Tax=Variovorax dokdonensis TaxID=344883 RepID=A0ABT7NC91_9BURK|nr:LolA-related protein [Variovorax dokdonensis]MDM0045572.1 outer membrane lipoprotein carrier protein LolA [Variovorax dokdonensis]